MTTLQAAIAAFALSALSCSRSPAPPPPRAEATTTAPAMGGPFLTETIELDGAARVVKIHSSATSTPTSPCVPDRCTGSPCSEAWPRPRNRA